MTIDRYTPLDRRPLVSADEARALLQPYLEAEKKGLELRATIPRMQHYIALCGLELDFNQADAPAGVAVIRRITNRPLDSHILGAMESNRTDAWGVLRYLNGIKAEVAVAPCDPAWTSDACWVQSGWHSVALFKLRGHPSLFAPCVSGESWDLLCLRDQHDVPFRMLDDTPRRICFGHNRPITLDDAAWVHKNWVTAFKLRGRDGSARFGLAFDVAYTWNHTSDLRVALANLWIGLEALFGDSADKKVTDALAHRISDWVPGTTKAEVTRLYRARCDAVHGRQIETAATAPLVERSAEIFISAMVTCIERTTSPLPDWKRAATRSAPPLRRARRRAKA